MSLWVSDTVSLQVPIPEPLHIPEMLSPYFSGGPSPSHPFNLTVNHLQGEVLPASYTQGRFPPSRAQPAFILFMAITTVCPYLCICLPSKMESP